jgi:hypothetical protein
VTVHSTFTCDYCNRGMAPDHDGGVAVTGTNLELSSEDEGADDRDSG